MAMFRLDFSPTFRSLAVPVTLAALLAACATPEGGSPPAASGSGASSASSARPAGAAPAATAAPAQPELSPVEAKATAQRLALQAVDQLQGGDESAARQTLDRALQLDPSNDIAKKLMEQINADAQKELGAVFFRYTVQPGDTLSKIAQQYMGGDRFRFWILAKYNDIANPSRVQVGQVIKVPGRAPPPVAADAGRPAAPPAPVAPEPPPNVDLTLALKKGADLQQAGNFEGSYAAFVDAVAKYPGSADAAAGRDASKASLIRNLDREASQAFQRQNLDLAITKYTRILEIDPGNKKAALERERAQDLKKRMADKFGGTPPPKK
jgi:tetratricopeptide (TPR) repeat protein